ncbi:MAG TPA: matrixin family metalloprotease [Pyrinomonadaceae bacterium]|jgi:predicted Zn-dependent protease
MRQLVTALLLSATLILSAVPVCPYTLQFTDSSPAVQLRWPGQKINIALSSSLTLPPANVKAGSDVVGAARRALAHWAEAANIRFVVAASERQSISAAGSVGDGVNLITLAHTPENSSAFQGKSSEMPARTRVFSNLAGNITEADVVLNPGQPFSTDGTPGTYDLEATLTHELGHLLGLEHSGVVGATMQPRQGRNGIYNLPSWTQRTLSEDDRAGVSAIYGRRLGTSARGAIAGTITFSSGAPVFGANVWAEELTTGRVSASNITLANGSYRIEGLLPGGYRLLAESLDGIVAAAEIAAPRGAYAGLSLNQPLPFRTEELGRVSVSAGTTLLHNAQLSGSPALINPSFIGLNSQLSTIAVPLLAGRTYRVYVAGEGINPDRIPAAGVTVASPFLSVDPASVAQADFGHDLSVLSFDVAVGAGAPAGDYSLRLQSLTGEIAYVAGGLVVEAPEGLASGQEDSLITPSFAGAGAAGEVAAGSRIVLSGAALTGEEVFEEHAAGPGTQTQVGLDALTVKLTYSSGVTVSAAVELTDEGQAGFRLAAEAAPGTALVEVLRNGRMTARAAIEIVEPWRRLPLLSGLSRAETVLARAEQP